jgi:hypothetical protein
MQLSSQQAQPVEAIVRYVVAHESGFRIGLEFTEESKQSAQAAVGETDYYEIMQLSPRADLETINRVYRIMATRYHPDNRESGDQEKFLLLSEAYRTLSDPESRARYDGTRSDMRQRPLPMFQAKAFVDERQGEANRRLGILCLLYAQRRRSQERPGIGLLELEELMGIPREYLEFTLWYLREKGHLEKTQGAEFSLTAEGVDFVEEHAPANTMMQRLLHGAGAASAPDASLAQEGPADTVRVQ